jgi:hypothetical protein
MGIINVTNDRYYGNQPISTYNRRKVDKIAGTQIDHETRTLKLYSYSTDCLDIFQNGRLLVDKVDYIAKDGKNIIFSDNITLSNNDIFVIYSWYSTGTADTTQVPRQEIYLVAEMENQRIFQCRYNPNNIAIYVNGLRLLQSEYEATDGEVIVLENGVKIGSTILVEVWDMTVTQFDLDSPSGYRIAYLTETLYSIAEESDKTKIEQTYDTNQIAVYKNRQRLYRGIDFEAQDGDVITFQTPLIKGDEILVETAL